MENAAILGITGSLGLISVPIFLAQSCLQPIFCAAIHYLKGIVHQNLFPYQILLPVTVDSNVDPENVKTYQSIHRNLSNYSIYFSDIDLSPFQTVVALLINHCTVYATSNEGSELRR